MKTGMGALWPEYPMQEAFVLKLKDKYLSVEREIEQESFQIYPNPCRGKFTLYLSSTESHELTLLNV